MKIGIIGAGNMGNGLAQKTAQEGLSVVMVDTSEEFVQRGLKNIRSTLNEAVERKILRPENVDVIMGRIKGTTDMAEVADCDLVIEAVFEDLKVKKELFTRLDGICDEKTVLATNTSSFFVDELAKTTNRPDRFIGLHFFYHPAKNRLLEIIPGSLTSDETLTLAKKYSKLTGKTDIQVKDAPGFVVNRFYVPYVNEAVRLLDEGIANIPTIEKAAMNCLGIGMGTFQLMNITGIHIHYHAQKTLFEKLGFFYGIAEGLANQFEIGELWNLEGEVEEEKIGTVCDRLLGCVFFTATSLLEEEVADITDIDVGAKVGLRWRKGPFEIMNDIGIDKSYMLVEQILNPFKSVEIPEILKIQKEKGKTWNICYVKYTRKNQIGIIKISRPDALNALNRTMLEQIDGAFKKAEEDIEAKVILIEAAGKTFIAGADIKFFIDNIKENNVHNNSNFAAYGHEVLNRIDECQKPVIVKMEGLALGGGLEFALASDIIVATSRAVMGFPETGIGIYPGLGGTQRTSRLIGKELAKYLVFTGKIINAEEAHTLGLVDYLCAPDEIDNKIQDLVSKGDFSPDKTGKGGELPDEWEKVRELFADANIESWLSGKYLKSEDPTEQRIAGIISSKAPLALELANRIIDFGYEKPLNEGLKEELDHLVEIFSTRDALTGLSNAGKKNIQFQGE